ncbi:MAG: fumarate/nitrate reduction transcriptional regulator Fnr [Pseudomonadota bacterium]
MNRPLSGMHCQNCSINQLCLPVLLAESEVEHLDTIIQRGRPLKKNDYLFHAGDKLSCLYAVRAGSLKSFSISDDGVEQITGFHLPGEIVGLDAISEDRHPTFIKALETSSVCAIPYERLEELSASITGLRQQLLRIMSKEILEDQALLLLLSKKSADERLAAFLMNLSSRLAQRGLSPTRFRLMMTRGDMGNYLGLAVETVSRILTRFQNDGLIAVVDRELEIKKFEKMAALAGVACELPT